MSADNPAQTPGMRTDLSSSAGAMARGAARGALGALIASVLALAFQAIVRHIVDIETMGLFTVATTVVVLAQLPALFGLEAGAIRYVSLGASAGDERAARGSAQAALVAGLTLSTLAAGALFLLAPEICERFNKPEATHLLQLAALALPLLCTSRVCAACVLGFGLTGRSSTISAAQNLARLLVTVPLVLALADVTALGVGFAIAGLAGTVFAIWLLRSVCPNILVPARDRWALRSMIGFSWPQTLSQSLYLATLWTDTLVLAHYGTAYQVGIYGLVIALLAPGLAADGRRLAGLHAAHRGHARARRQRLDGADAAARLVLEPRRRAADPRARWRSCASRCSRSSGSGYAAGAAPLVLLAIGQLVLNAAGPLTAVINLSGHPRVTLFNNCLVFSANLVLCIILVPRYGMTGAAASTLIALCSVTLLQVGQVGPAVPHPPVPRRPAALPRSRRRGRCGDRRAHAAALARAAARGRRGRPRVHRACTSPASPRSACSDETRELAQRARNRILRRGSTW